MWHHFFLHFFNNRSMNDYTIQGILHYILEFTGIKLEGDMGATASLKEQTSPCF